MRLAIFTALLLISLGAVNAMAADAFRWYLVQDQSRLTYNNPASGGIVPIKTYYADIFFDPDKLSASHIMITADISTLFLNGADVNVAELNKMPPTVEVLPDSPATAVFKSDTIKKGSNGQYLAEGKLTANKVTRRFVLPFAARLSKHETGVPMLSLDSSFTIDRSEYTTRPMGQTGPTLIPFQITISAIPGKP
jgi:polyisoprenoid-binding protein YceI